MRKRIALDLDSTLNCLGEAWCKWVRETHDPDFHIGKWLTWTIKDHTTAGTKAHAFLAIPGVFESLDVSEGSQRVTERLAEKHDLFVATASDHPECIPEKVRWLQKHFPHIPKKNFVFTEAKYLLRTDLLIDDGAHNAIGFEGKFLLLDKPWNQPSTESRVKGWSEAEAWLEGNGWL